MAGTTKRRLIRTAEKYLVNPPTKLALRLGVPMPLVLIETIGRRSAQPRRTAVMNGLVGDQLWVVAEHGRRADYVRNLAADPRVRVKVARRWRDGIAHMLADDDPYRRAEWVAEQLWRSKRMERWVTRFLSVDPVTVRIDLTTDSPPASGPAESVGRTRRDLTVGAALVGVSGLLMIWAGYLFATAGLNAALLESIVPGVTIEAAYATYRRIDRAGGRSRPSGVARLVQEAVGLTAGLLMAVGGYAAARWSWPVASALIVAGLPVISAAVVLGRSRNPARAPKEKELVG